MTQFGLGQCYAITGQDSTHNNLLLARQAANVQATVDRQGTFHDQIRDKKMRNTIAVIAAVLVTSATFADESTFESVQTEFQQKALSLLSEEDVSGTDFSNRIVKLADETFGAHPDLMRKEAEKRFKSFHFGANNGSVSRFLGLPKEADRFYDWHSATGVFNKRRMPRYRKESATRHLSLALTATTVGTDHSLFVRNSHFTGFQN
jgi:hypothetical protein